MKFSAALDPLFCRLSFLSESQQSELLELLVSAAKSISYSTTGPTNESNDAAQSVEPPSKKRSVLDHLLDEEKQDDELSVQDEVKLYLQEHPIKQEDDPWSWQKVYGS